MKKILIRGMALALALILGLSAAALGVSAAEPEVRVPVTLRLPEAVAGVEFQLECSDGLEFQSLVKSDDLSGASMTPVVDKQGVSHFGFYSADNRYAAGTLQLGELVILDAGDGGTVRITEARTVRVLDKETTEATVYPLEIVFAVPEDAAAGVEINLTDVEPEEPDDDSGETGDSGTGGGTSSGGSTGTTTDTGSQGLPFTDVGEQAWFYGAVAYVYENNLMNGTSATLFTPNGSTTRAMVVTTLWRMEGQPKAETDSGFGDLTQTWYLDAVSWAAEQGIVTGYSAEAFGPEDPVTREQLAAILYRYAAYEGKDVSARTELTAYVDGGRVAAWAEESLEWACAVKLITGKTGGLLDPQGNGSRAELATLLQRYATL